MAFFEFDQPLVIPSGSLGSQTQEIANLDAAGEALGHVFAKGLNYSGVIDSISFHVGTLNSSGDIEVGLETLSGRFPSNALVAAGASGSATLSAAGVVTVALDTPYTYTAGDPIAITYRNDSVAFPDWRDMSNSEGVSGVCVESVDGINWASGNRFPKCVVHFADGKELVPNPVNPITTTTTPNVLSTSNPDERGNRYQLPYGIRIDGICWQVFTNGTAFYTGIAEVRIYDASDSVLFSTTLDFGQVTKAHKVEIPVPSLEIPANTLFRVTFRSTTTNAVRGYRGTWISTAEKPMRPGLALSSTSRHQGGAWSENELEEHAFFLILSAIDTGGGGGTVTKFVPLED